MIVMHVWYVIFGVPPRLTDYSTELFLAQMNNATGGQWSLLFENDSVRIHVRYT